MPDNPTNIPVYTADDLLRYAIGRMTAQEMYTLEKATMEDPFLAEALEGYHAAAASHTEPVLQKSVDKLTLKTPQKNERKGLPLWRTKAFQIAAAAALLLGASWFTYSLVNNKEPEKQQDIAMVPKQEQPDASAKKQNKNLQTDSTNYNNPPLPNETAAVKPAPATNPEKNKDVAVQDKAQRDDRFMSANDAVASGNQDPPPVIRKDSMSAEKADNTHIAKDAYAKNETGLAPGTVANNKTAIADASTQNESVAKRRMESQNTAGRSVSNTGTRYVFHGKITDAKNNPLPYANVMINGEGVGTYTDTKGSFNLVYDDSILPVRTRSLGYESQIVQMKPGKTEQQIIMPEDEKLKESLALTVQKPMARQQGIKPLIIETDSLSSAQPVVSLFDYNTYLLNNNRLNEFPKTSTRAVELSFEVDKRGEIKNITVEQSSGKEMDEEAIRLLKEGPKWKSNKSAGRAKVKVKL